MTDKMLEELTAAIEAIAADRVGKGPLPHYGHVVCPKCGGRLYYAVIGPRAHRAGCTTARCLEWIG